MWPGFEWLEVKGGCSTCVSFNAPIVVAEYLHMLLLWAYVGPPPFGVESYGIHVCANEWCINPKHLYWASNSSNRANTRESHTAVVAAAAGTRGGMLEWGLPP